MLVAMPHLADLWTTYTRNRRHGTAAWEGAAELPKGSGPAFTLTLFSLMGHQTTFDNAVFLVEEILADRAVPFPLAAVKTLPKLVEATLSTRQLAFFCRVLALTVLDAEERGVAAPPSDEFGENVSESMANMLRRDADDEAASITDATFTLFAYSSPHQKGQAKCEGRWRSGPEISYVVGSFFSSPTIRRM